MMGKFSRAASMAWDRGVREKGWNLPYRQRDRERRCVQRGGETDDAEAGKGGIEAPSGIEFWRR